MLVLCVFRKVLVTISTCLFCVFSERFWLPSRHACSVCFQKGSGYHLDMLVLCVLVVVLSIFGLPWYVAATVTALAHIMSLRKESECTAPGEKPMFLGIR